MRQFFVGMLAAGVAIAACNAWAQDSQPFTSPIIPSKQPVEMPQEVKAAWACVTGGSIGTAAAVAAGSENLINLVAGGIVAPQSRAVLVLGLAGVVFTTFCTLGQQLLPLYQYYFDSPDRPQTAPETAEAPPPPSGRVPANWVAEIQ